MIGVVKEFKQPATTRGSDYYSTLTLVDETEPRVGVKCVLFNKSPERLPQVKQVGDVVCLHRANVTSYNCQPQVQGVRYTSAIRFSGGLLKKISPCTGSVSFTCTRVERQRVKALRAWAREMRLQGSLRLLDKVAPGGGDHSFDLVCQLVSVTVSKSPRCTLLAVWDATPHSLRCMVPRLERREGEEVEEEEGGYPEVRAHRAITEDSEGYQAHVVIYNKKCIRQASKLLPGQFLYLQNLRVVTKRAEGGTEREEDEEERVELTMQREEGVLLDCVPPRIELLEKRDQLHAALERRIEQAIASVTVTLGCDDQPLCRVADVTSPARPLPAKFRCRAKVLQVTTPSLEEMVVAHCPCCNHTQLVTSEMEADDGGVFSMPCPSCKGSANPSPGPPRLSSLFYFKMTVGDGSGRMEVAVAHEEATRLFGGLRPSNMYRCQELRYRVMEKLHALTGGNPPFDTPRPSRVGEITRPRPWINCCILAAKHNDTVYYCLFDTELKSN